jgi:hypothetical protein
MKDCHPTTEDPKVALLEKLYKEDGRGEKTHPMHGLYTGLYQDYMSKGEQNVSS